MDDQLALVGKSIQSYLVVDRRNQGPVLVVLRLGVATLRGRNRLLRHSNDVPGLLSVTSVFVPNQLDVAMALLGPILGRNLVPPHNKCSRPTSMEVDVLTDLLATARDRRPDGKGPSQGNSSR